MVLSDRRPNPLASLQRCFIISGTIRSPPSLEPFVQFVRPSTLFTLALVNMSVAGAAAAEQPRAIAPPIAQEASLHAPPPDALSTAAALGSIPKLAVDLLRDQAASGLRGALVHPSARTTGAALQAAQLMLETTKTSLLAPQALLVVDRAPSVQRLWVILADQTARPWVVVAAVKVSTGKPGRKEHFKTPVGVFTNTPQILGYRAQGTYNEHGIRGNGVKGMRVWDFGWQTTEDWRTPGAVASVRMELHATDPTFLERRLGRPDSEGYIRIPAVFDRFLDRFGLLDAQLTPLAASTRSIAALLPRDATPFPFPGDKIIVVDTSEPEARPSDPAEAQAIQTRFAEWLRSSEKSRGAGAALSSRHSTADASAGH